MSRCLTWAIVGEHRVECMSPQGHGGMHLYPKEPGCLHPTIIYNDETDVVSCITGTCRKEWK